MRFPCTLFIFHRQAVSHSTIGLSLQAQKRAFNVCSKTKKVNCLSWHCLKSNTTRCCPLISCQVTGRHTDVTIFFLLAAVGEEWCPQNVSHRRLSVFHFRKCENCKTIIEEYAKKPFHCSASKGKTFFQH